MALLAISMVANNFFGRSKSFTTSADLELVAFSSADKSVEESPKKATSAPDIRAEQAIKNNKTPILMGKRLGSMAKPMMA